MTHRILSYLVLVCLIGTASLAQTADSQQQSDIQQLKDKVQQLEQTVQALKQQINAAEQTQTLSQPATTTQAMQSVRSSAQAQDQTVPLEGEVTEKEGAVDMYGYVMLDSGYNFGQNDPNWFDVVRPTKLPSFANEFAPSGNVFAGVRQTRFGVKSNTPTKFGDLKTLFEFELFGTGVDAGQTTFRLRHAYGELGAIGAGQTWSPFMDISVFPNSLEYWGPNGMVFFRNVQFRVMPVRTKRADVTLALERPGASGDQGVYAGRIELQNIKPRFNFPDLSGHVKVMGDWGHVQLAGIVRKIGWVDTTADTPFKLGSSVVGWGVNASSVTKLGKHDTARLEFTYGKGIENYMNDAPIDIGVQHNPSNPVTPVLGVPLPVAAVVSFLDHDWSSRFSTSLGYSMLNIENSNAQLPSDFHQGHYALTNLLYHPVPKVTIGGEFQFGRRLNFTDGFNYNDYRMQFSLKYDWDKGFTYKTQ